ncbi:MAG: tRNA (pseudouridine(54)-N(1))-methyltransferase TrmY [Methanoregulaceae archaeon]|nr:tRNA (pseudouridine(54)-N(1))-methyltransferase TrmY [Methanoregulaceae archaeon]
MIRFAVVGHQARTTGDFSLNDLPGSAGRMDIICRCIRASLFLSHDLRRDVECYLVLLGEPEPPKTVLFSGEAVRYLSPDERSAGSLLKKALATTCGRTFRESTPGVFVRKGGLDVLLTGHEFAVLHEEGKDIRKEEAMPGGFILSDNRDFTGDEEVLFAGMPRYSLGPRTLHAEDCITVVLNELDRRAPGWS